MERSFRAIVVGLGAMGSTHLRVLSEIDAVTVVAGVDPSEECRAQIERRRGLPTFASLADAVAAVEADLACIATPVQELAPSALAALEAGLAVLVEKPLAADEESARDVVATAERLGLTLGVGLVERCNPAVRSLRERLARGDGGRVYQLHSRRLSPFPYRDSMLGVSVDLATHDIDVMRSLTGEEIQRVSAESAQRQHQVAEDLICSTVRFDSGATGLLEVNWLTPTKVRELTVTCDNGMYVLNYLTQELFFYERPTKRVQWGALASMVGPDEGDMVRYALERREPLRVEWEGFLTAIEQGTEPLATGQDGLAALSTARAIQRSAAEHAFVEPDYRSASPSPR